MLIDFLHISLHLKLNKIEDISWVIPKNIVCGRSLCFDAYAVCKSINQPESARQYPFALLVQQ